MSKTVNHLLGVLLILFVSSCGGSKKVAEEQAPPSDPRPSWVKARPFEPGMYIGIGSAPKLGSGSDHQIQAKNQALNDLASEISISISGSSLLYQMEDNDSYTESFQSNVKTRTAEQLSGYDVAGIYEDDRRYWVMYQLDKQDYARDKERRMAKAVEFSLFHRKEAIEHLNKDEDILAIENYLKALEDIHDFWNESLKTEIDGETDFLGKRLFAELSSAVRGVNITAINKELDWKISQELPRGLLEFQVRSHNGSTLANAPVYVNLKGYRLRPNQIRSNNVGKVFIDDLPKGIEPGRSELMCTLNLVAIIERSTSDPMISLMANSISPAQASTSLFFSYPSVQIIPSEKTTSEEKQEGFNPLSDELESLLLKDGFEVVNSGADMFLEVESSTTHGQKMDRFYSAYLNGRLRLLDNNGRLLEEVRLEDIKGVQLSFEQAETEAYSKAQKEIQKRYYRDLIRSVFED